MTVFSDVVIKKMCHQRGGLRPHQQLQTTTSTRLILSWWIFVCVHTRISLTSSKSTNSDGGEYGLYLKIPSCMSLCMIARLQAIFQIGKIAALHAKSTSAWLFQIAIAYGNTILLDPTAPDRPARPAPGTNYVLAQCCSSSVLKMKRDKKEREAALS